MLVVANVTAADSAPDAAADNVKNDEIAQFGKLVVVGDRFPFFKRFNLILFGTRYLFGGRPRESLRVCEALLDMSESPAETDFAETCIAGAKFELGDFEGAEGIVVAKMAKLCSRRQGGNARIRGGWTQPRESVSASGLPGPCRANVSATRHDGRD